MPQHQSYWYPTVHYCSSTNPIETSHSTTVPVRVLRIPYSPLLFNYQSYWYDTVDYSPSTHPTDMLNPVLPQCQSFWYSVVYFCPGTSPTDTSQSISVLIPVLLIPCLSTRPIDSPKLPKYQSTTISVSDLLTRLSTSAPVPVLLIPYSTTDSVPDLSIRQSTTAQYQYYWYAAEHKRLPHISPTDTLQYTTAPVPVLLTRHSPLLPK